MAVITSSKMRVTGITLKKIQILESELLKIQNKLEMKIPLSPTCVLRTWTMHANQITTEDWPFMTGNGLPRMWKGQEREKRRNKMDLGEEQKEEELIHTHMRYLRPWPEPVGLHLPTQGWKCSCMPVWSHSVANAAHPGSQIHKWSHPTAGSGSPGRFQVRQCWNQTVNYDYAQMGYPPMLSTVKSRNWNL